MKIANIIFENELVNHSQVSYVNYINTSLEYSKIDNDLPTLYVGWFFMKKINIDDKIIQNTNILSKEVIPNKLYWEFSFSENKSSHVKGIDSFINMLPTYKYISKYEFINIDPVFNNIRNINELFTHVPIKISKIYCYKDEIMYLLNDNKIWGINLKMYKYFKFTVNDIVFGLGERLMINGEYIVDDDGTYYQSFYKILPNFELLRRYIVTI